MRRRWKRTTPLITPSRQAVEAMVREGIPDARVKSVAAVDGGLANTNLRVELDSEPVLLRLYQRDPREADKEAALTRLLGSRVPVARVLHGGTHDGQRFAIVEWVEGERLETLADALDDADLARAGRSVGAALAGVHSFRFAQAGFLDADLNVAPFPESFGLANFLRGSLIEGRGAARIDAALARRIVAFAETHESPLEAWSSPPRLVHFDFNGSNILMGSLASPLFLAPSRKGRGNPCVVAAVLDWEFAAVASPANDFGNLLRPPLGTRAGFADGVADGYRAGGGTLPEDWLRLARLADLSAWAEFLSRDDVDATLIADARAVFEAMLKS